MPAQKTILLIHGVGDLPNEATRGKNEQLIKARHPDEDLRFLWFDWNQAIQDQRSISASEIGAITSATRACARLEFPSIVQPGLRAGLWRIESWAAKMQLPIMAFCLYHGIWLAAAWAATLVPQGPLPLELTIGIDNVLFPPLDPVFLTQTLPAALRSIPISAIVAFLIVPVLQVLIALISGAVPFRVALRAAVLDVSRPLIGLLAAPGLVITALIFIAAALAFGFAVVSRPVQIVDLAGATISYGERWGIMALPIAMVAICMVTGLSSFLLRTPLKVISDIVRYLGHPDYRARIHGYLNTQLEKIPGGPVIIVAHSLGSVIAVDSLAANPHAWSRFDRLRLLTCGSPLQRLFHGFFPATYPAADTIDRELNKTFANFAWLNAYRPLDYVGTRLGRTSSIVEKRLRQRLRLHIGYWTDRQLVDLVGRFIDTDPANAKPHRSDDIKALFSFDRFLYAPVGGKVLLDLSLILLFIGGGAMLVFFQFIAAPQVEKEHLSRWRHRLAIEGVDLQGQFCPQREEDVSGHFEGFQRAVAGISYRTPDDRKWVLEAYSDSRPDIDWDQVQRAVFGRVPPSPLITGLRSLFFLKDPLLKIVKCQPVDLVYAKSDPRMFTLPARFHRQPRVSVLVRTGRTLLLFFIWTLWWGLVSFILKQVLGVEKRTPNDALDGNGPPNR